MPWAPHSFTVSPAPCRGEGQARGSRQQDRVPGLLSIRCTGCWSRDAGSHPSLRPGPALSHEAPLSVCGGVHRERARAWPLGRARLCQGRVTQPPRGGVCRPGCPRRPQEGRNARELLPWGRGGLRGSSAGGPQHLPLASSGADGARPPVTDSGPGSPWAARPSRPALSATPPSPAPQ